jgi:hypothetical protein
LNLVFLVKQGVWEGEFKKARFSSRDFHSIVRIQKNTSAIPTFFSYLQNFTILLKISKKTLFKPFTIDFFCDIIYLVEFGNTVAWVKIAVKLYKQNPKHAN